MSDAWLLGADGWLQGVRQVSSPNFDGRPPETPIDLVVLHNISLPPGQFETGDIEAFFTNQLDSSRHPFFETIHRVEVSAHFLIERSGSVVQFVSCDERAWHAGLSEFFGRTRCNDFSVGVEVEGCDDLPFEAAQYETLTRLLAVLCSHYPIRAVVGHSDIAPGRKTDPGPHFDWERLMRTGVVPPEGFPYQRWG
jgi:AmpD protein